MQHDIVSEFLRWWSKPQSSPDFSARFARPIRYQRGGGVNDEDALWLIEQSMGHDDVEVVSESSGRSSRSVTVHCTDPVTLLRHRVSFTLVADGERIVSVVERGEILGT